MANMIHPNHYLPDIYEVVTVLAVMIHGRQLKITVLKAVIVMIAMAIMPASAGTAFTAFMINMTVIIGTG
jgi:hypothetical protein